MPEMTSANGVIFFQFISLIGSLFFITQLFRVGLGYSPLGAGLRILVWMAMPMLVAPVAGALADRVGNRPFMFFGLALQAAGLGWLAAVVRPGVSYASPTAFIDGFRPAEWVAAAVAAVGVPIAALAPSKSAQEEIR